MMIPRHRLRMLRFRAGRFVRAALLSAAAAAALTFALGVLPSSAPEARAQSASSFGVVTGRVFNPATGDYVRNAEVRIEGSSRIAFTEADGSFRLDGVPAGSATVVVSFSGFRTESATLLVAAGQTASRDFELRSSLGAPAAGSQPRDGEVIQLAAFVVSSEREGNAKAIMEQRAAMNIRNTVASDIFGDVAEGNVGEFLKFMPGIDLDYAEADTRSVRIRGLAPKYAAVMFDGNRLASAASSNLATGRAFEFEQVSINSVDTIEVNKTIQADMDADAPAGAINFRSKSALNRKGRLITWQANVVANSNEFTFSRTQGPGEGVHRKIMPGGIVEYSDTFLNGRLGVVATISESNMYNDQLRVQNTYDNVPTAARPEAVVPVTIRWKDGPKFTERTATSLNLDYRLNRYTVASLRSQFNNYDAEFHNRQVMAVMPRVRLAAGSSETTVIANATTSTSNVTRIVLGGNSQNKFGNTGSVSPAIEYKRDRLQLDANFSFSQSINHYEDLKAGFFYNHDAWLTPVSFRLDRTGTGTSDWSFTQLSGRDATSLASYQSSAQTNVTNSQPRSARNRQWAGQANVRWSVPWKMPAFLKAGIKVREQDYRLANYNYSWTYVGPDNNRTTAVVPVSNIHLDPQKGGDMFAGRTFEFPDRAALADLFREHPEYFTPNPTNLTSDANRFAQRFVREQIDAAYVMGNIQLGALTLQSGLRVERTRTGAKIFERGIPAYRTGDYQNDFLSASAKYRFSKNFMAILSGAQSILRPDFGNLTGVATINDELMTGTIPNPELRPERANNYSGRLEYYFEPVGVIAVGGFLNDIRDIQYQGRNIAAEEIGLEHLYPGYTFTSWRNADSLRLRGLEVEYSQQLSFLPGVFGGLGVFANYTRNLTSDLVTAGKVAPKIASGGVSFRYRGFNASLKCNWTDDTYDSSGASSTNVYTRYKRARTMVDVNLSFPLTRRTSFFVSGRNIADAPSLLYENTRDLLYQHDQFGATWTFGVKGRF